MPGDAHLRDASFTYPDLEVRCVGDLDHKLRRVQNLADWDTTGILGVPVGVARDLRVVWATEGQLEVPANAKLQREADLASAAR